MDDEHWVATEPSPRHVRAVFGGTTVADSKRVLLLRERGHVGVYYFPMDDARMDLFERTDKGPVLRRPLPARVVPCRSSRPVRRTS